ncbi:MAG: hypothetical protein RJQ09_14505 [Cyclobacteriaceae bacterium]
MIQISFFIVVILLAPEFVKAQSFTPYPERPMRLVQGISFTPDGKTMYFTLPHKEYLESKGMDSNDDTPILAIYSAVNDNGTWSTPEPIPFLDKYKEYEPTLSPDGKLMLFNSNRPKSGTKPQEKNDIWFSEKVGEMWSAPRNLGPLNTELEESYPSITNDSTLIYVAEKIINGVSEYAIHITRFNGTNTLPGVKIKSIDEPQGCGDPWISPNGNYMIFTKFDNDRWQETCDLYVSYNQNGVWSEPAAIEPLNGEGPDFSPAVSPDGKWIYYRKNYQFVKVAVPENLMFR